MIRLALAFLLASLCVATPSRAEKGMIGGMVAYQSCVAECRGPDGDPSLRKVCPQLCECALTVDFASIGEELSTVRTEHRVAMCKAKFAPGQFKAPPPLPPTKAEQERAASVEVAKVIDRAKGPDGSPRLHRHRVKALDFGDWIGDFASPQLRKMYVAVRQGGQQVLQCTYGPVSWNETMKDYSYRSRSFWYGRPPADIDTMLRRNDPRGALKPLGAVAAQTCPATLSAAQALANPPTRPAATRPNASPPADPRAARDAARRSR